MKCWFWRKNLQETTNCYNRIFRGNKGYGLDCKEIQPVHPKGDQSSIFIGRTDAEAEAPILLPTDAKNWLIGNDPDAGKDWRQEEKGTTEGETVGWHHRLNGREFEQILGDGEGQGSLACCSPWGCKESDMTRDWTTTKNIYTHTFIYSLFFPHGSVVKEFARQGRSCRRPWFYPWVRKIPWSRTW